MGELFDSVFLYFSGLLEVVLEIIFYGRFVGKEERQYKIFCLSFSAALSSIYR